MSIIARGEVRASTAEQVDRAEPGRARSVPGLSSWQHMRITWEFSTPASVQPSLTPKSTKSISMAGLSKQCWAAGWRTSSKAQSWFPSSPSGNNQDLPHRNAGKTPRINTCKAQEPRLAPRPRTQPCWLCAWMLGGVSSHSCGKGATSLFPFNVPLIVIPYYLSQRTQGCVGCL